MRVIASGPGATRLGCLLGCLLSMATPAFARTFVVDSVLDEADLTSADGECRTGAGSCTLRAAVNQANSTAAADVVILPAGTYTLTIPPGDVSTSQTGDLDVVHHLTIRGAGADVTVIDANRLERAFEVMRLGGLFTPLRFRLSGVSIVNGDPPANYGGGIATFAADVQMKGVTVASNQADLGGGIDVISGRLTLIDSRIHDNVGRRCCAGIRANFQARIVVKRSTIDRNVTTGPQASGGGIFCFPGTELQLLRSEVRDNRVTGSGAGIRYLGVKGRIDRTVIRGNLADGGAAGLSLFANESDLPAPNPLAISNSLITENVADADGDGNGYAGGIHVTYPTWASPLAPFLARTTVTGNIDPSGQAPDCSGEVVDAGGATIGDRTGCVVVRR